MPGTMDLQQERERLLSLMDGIRKRLEAIRVLEEPFGDAGVGEAKTPANGVQHRHANSGLRAAIRSAFSKQPTRVMNVDAVIAHVIDQGIPEESGGKTTLRTRVGNELFRMAKLEEISRVGKGLFVSQEAE